MKHVVVTLVHGTYSHDAAWVRPGSVLRDALTRQLGDQLEFVVFRWSGKNSHAARAAAGIELRQALAESLTRSPSSRHIVVAHSHGGNVARYALRDPVIGQRVDGLVCMGTPFIVCAEREESGLLTLFIFMLCGLPFLIVGAVFMVMDRAGPGSLAGSLAFGVMMVVLLLFALFRMFGFERVLRPLEPLLEMLGRWNIRHTERLAARLLVAPLRTPVFCARALGDEAAWLLSRVDAAAELPFGIVGHIAIALGLAGYGAGFVAYCAALAMHWFQAGWIAGLMTAGSGVIAICTAAALAVLLFMVVAPVVRVPVLGWEAPLDLWRFRIAVEPVPNTGAHQKLYELGASPSPSGRWLPRLQHCSLYEDPGVIEDVAHWIRDRVGVRARR